MLRIAISNSTEQRHIRSCSRP